MWIATGFPSTRRCPRTGTTTCAMWYMRARTRPTRSARSRWTWPGGASTNSRPIRPRTPRCEGWRASGWRGCQPSAGSVGPVKPGMPGFPAPRSVQHARPQRARDRRQLVLQRIGLGLVGADVDHHVADLGVGAQELAVDVQRVAAEDLVDLRQHARHVAVDVQQAPADFG